MVSKPKLISFLAGGTAIALLGVTAVYAQVVMGTQDFSITVEEQADITPDAFVFASVLNSEPNTQVTSALTTISGLEGLVPVSVAGLGFPEISLDEGVTWVTEGEISNGGTILVRLTSGPLFYSGSAFNTTRQAIVTVGDLDGSFLVRNRAGNTEPEAFAFAAGTGAATNTLVTSDPVTITGLEMGSPISVSGTGSPQVSVAGGAWSDTGTVENGQSVRVRFTTPRIYEATSSATVTIGGISAAWSVLTKDCVSGDLFTLGVGDSTCYGNRDVVNAGPGIITVGTTGSDYISWAAANSLCSGLGAEWGLPPLETMTGAGSINVNRSISGIESVLDETNSSTYWTSTPTQTVSMGPLPLVYTGVNSSAAVICMTQPWLTDQFVASDYVPDSFTIPATSGSPDTFLMSDPITIAGLESGKSVFLRVSSASTNGAPTFSVNGGSYEGTERLVTNGDTVRFGIKSALFNGGSLTVSAQTRDPAGTVNRDTVWSVTSVAAPTESVDTFAFNWEYFPQTYFGSFPGNIYESDIITLSGGTGQRPLRLLNSSGNYNSGTLNRWPALYGTRIYFASTNTTITTSLTNDSNRVAWARLESDYPDVVTDVGRQIRLKYTPANNSEETYTVLCVAYTCAEHIWSNSATGPDPRASNPFDVVDVTGADLETVYTSDPFIVSWDARTAGVQAPNIPISISGTGSPEYRVNGGAWTNVAGWVGAGSTVEVRLTSAASSGTDRTATLSVGTTTSDYVVRTLDDTTPDAFAFVAANGAAPNTQVISAPVSITGISTAVPVSITGEGAPQLSTDAGATWATTGTVAPNGSVLVRLTSASAYEAVRTATLDVNGETSSWTVTTAPFTFAVSGKTDVLLSALTVSDPVTMPAYLTASAISVSGGGSPQYSINGGAFTGTSGTISAGQVLRVRLTAASTKDAELVATVTIGSATAAFSVRTAPPEACETGSVGSICSDGAIYAGTANGNKIFAASAGSGSLRAKTTRTATFGMTSNDGLENMRIAALAGIANHSASQACAAMGSEWVLPSSAELQVMYTNRNLMPTGTYLMSSSTTSKYWSSTQSALYDDRAVQMTFSSGAVAQTYKDALSNVHCIRYSREEPRLLSDPCQGSPSVGDVCADMSVYAGTVAGEDYYVPYSGPESLRSYKSSSTETLGAIHNDGIMNMAAITADGIASYPAANACNAKGAGWYLPSSFELSGVAANLNTAGLSAELIADTTDYFWASDAVYDGDGDRAKRIYWSTAAITDTTKITNHQVMCVKNDTVRVATDPCAGTPSIGALCANGTVYFGSIDGRDLFTSKADQGTFRISSSTAANAATTNLRDGRVNMAGMVGTSYDAANACRALGAGWYLPARDELALMATNANGLFLEMTFGSTGDYWSSTQFPSITSRNYDVDLTGGFQGYTSKTNSLRVRCIFSE